MLACSSSRLRSAFLRSLSAFSRSCFLLSSSMSISIWSLVPSLPSSPDSEASSRPSSFASMLPLASLCLTEKGAVVEAGVLWAGLSSVFVLGEGCVAISFWARSSSALRNLYISSSASLSSAAPFVAATPMLLSARLLSCPLKTGDPVTLLGKVCGLCFGEQTVPEEDAVTPRRSPWRLPLSVKSSLSSLGDCDPDGRVEGVVSVAAATGDFWAAGWLEGDVRLCGSSFSIEEISSSSSRLSGVRDFSTTRGRGDVKSSVGLTSRSLKSAEVLLVSSAFSRSSSMRFLSASMSACSSLACFACGSLASMLVSSGSGEVFPEAMLMLSSSSSLKSSTASSCLSSSDWFIGPTDCELVMAYSWLARSDGVDGILVGDGMSLGSSFLVEILSSKQSNSSLTGLLVASGSGAGCSCWLLFFLG